MQGVGHRRARVRSRRRGVGAEAAWFSVAWSSIRHALIGCMTAALLVGAVGAVSASALIVHLGNNKALSYQPLRGVPCWRGEVRSPVPENCVYHGGPVMPSNTNYTFYWAPSGSPDIRGRLSVGGRPLLRRPRARQRRREERRLGRHAVHGLELTGGQLRLAFRRRDRRHEPVSRQRLQSLDRLSHRRADPGGDQELRESARPAGGSRRTSTSCSRLRESESCFSAVGDRMLGGNDISSVLRLPRRNRRRRAA